jgi:fucose permease
VLLVVLLPYYQALLALFFLIGASTRLLESVVNAYVSDLHPEHRGFYLLLLHAFFGVGALLGPVVSTVVLYAGMHWSKIFVGLAALCVLVLLVYLAAEAKSKRGAGRMEVTSLPVLVALLRSRQVWVLCLLSMLYVGFANGLSIWIPSYVRETFHLRDFWGSFPVTALWMGIISGRVSYSFLSLRFRVRPLLLMSNAAAAAVSVAMMVVNTYLALSVGLALAGFLVGATNPLAISLLNEMFPKNRGAVTSAVTFTGALGLMTIPWLAGVVAEWAGFFWGLVVLGACPCGLMLLSLVLLFSGGGRLDPAVLGGTRS